MDWPGRERGLGLGLGAKARVRLGSRARVRVRVRWQVDGLELRGARIQQVLISPKSPLISRQLPSSPLISRLELPGARMQQVMHGPLPARVAWQDGRALGFGLGLG